MKNKNYIARGTNQVHYPRCNYITNVEQGRSLIVASMAIGKKSAETFNAIANHWVNDA